ncbi:MAG: Ig-like domain-containing protein [Deltaproteobacteria bacterium]|nr:Ig-like domain-containing protein [Deltaproteobacteria bacterium]
MGAAPAKVLVIATNFITGESVTVTSGADGSYSLSIAALVTDRLGITYRDPDGNETTFSPGPFRTDDGAYIMGEAGGTVPGPSNIYAIVPEGAVPEGTKIKLAPISAAALPKALPPDFEFLGGIDLDMGDVVATQELKLSIANPEGSGLTPQSQVFVFKEIEVAGQSEYSLNNIARLADNRLTTASPPFPGAEEKGDYFFVRPFIPMSVAKLYIAPLSPFIKNLQSLDYGGVVFGWNDSTRLYVEIMVPMTCPLVMAPMGSDFFIGGVDPIDGHILDPINFPPIDSLDAIEDIYLPDVTEQGEPNIISRSPSDNLTNVPVERGIQVLFDKPVISNTIKVTVAETGGGDFFEDLVGEEKPGTGHASAIDYTDAPVGSPVAAGVTFVPERRLKYDTDYTVTLTGVNGQIEKDDGNGGKTIDLAPLPDCQKTFTFHTFCPRFLGAVGIATPRDIAVFDDNRIYVANGKAENDSESQNKGVVIVDTSIPVRLKRTGAEHNISGNTLGVAIARGAAGYTGVVAVSGGTNYISQVRFIPTDMQSYRRTLISMDSVSLLNGITLNNVPYYSGVSMAVSVIGGVACIANLGVGVQFAPIEDMTPDWNATIGNNVEPGLNVLNAQNGTIDHNNGFLNLGWEIPTPKCIDDLHSTAIVGDSENLYLISGNQTNVLAEKIYPIAIDAVADFPYAYTQAESGPSKNVVFVAGKKYIYYHEEIIDTIYQLFIYEITGTTARLLNDVDYRLSFNGTSTVKASKRDRLLYVGDSNGIHVVDVFDLSKPRILGRVKGPGKTDFTARVNDVDLGASFGFAAVPNGDNGSVVSFPIRSCIESIKRDGDHKSPGDKTYHIGSGEAANFRAVKSPGVSNVVWSIVETGHNDKSAPVRRQLHPNGDTCVVSVDKESGSGWILLRAANADIPSCYMDRLITIGCQACTTGCAEKVPGSCDASNSCVSVRFNMGRAGEGLSAGELYIHSLSPDPGMATPYGLNFTPMADGVEVLYGQTGEIRQILAPETFVEVVDVYYKDGEAVVYYKEAVNGEDIVKFDRHAYELRFYSPSAVGPMGTDGLYTVNSGAIPIKSWIVSDPDKDGTSLSITENGTGNRVYSYAWIETAQDWTLTSGNGLRVDAKANSIDANGDRILTETTSGAAGAPSVTKTWFHKYPWGEEPVKIVTDPDGFALTETITYYWEDPSAPGYGRIKSRTQPDGSWVAYQYDEHGRVTREFRPWLSGGVSFDRLTTRAVSYSYSPVDAAETITPESFWEPRVITETVLGKVTGKTFSARLIASDGAITEISEQAWAGYAVYGDSHNLRTVTTYYPEAEGEAQSGKLKSVLSPDGRLTTYAYDYGSFDGVSAFTVGGGLYLRTSVTHGTESSPAGIAGKTTREVSVDTPTGVSVYSETEVYDGSACARVSWTRNTLDSLGRVERTDSSDGTFTQTGWTCCQKESETDAEGVTTTFIYDDLGRVISQTREGLNGSVVTDFVLDAAGRELSRRVTAGGIVQMSSTAYDTAGRQISTTDEAGLVTTYAYAYDGTFHISTNTVTQPGGATQVTESFADGRTKSVTGTGSTPQHYEYGVNDDGTQWTKTSMVMPDSAMWETTTTDLFGRTIKTEKPGFGGIVETVNVYDTKGHLARTIATGRAGTLTVYDELGEVAFTALDVNGNDLIDIGGPDRVQSSESTFVLDGGVWWQKSSQSVYVDPSGAATVTGQALQRLTGLGAGGLTGESKSLDVNGNVTISRTYLDRADHRRTSVTDYPDSDTDETSVTRFGLTVSATGKTNVTTTFIYDALGRQISVTDQRKGTSTTHYDPKGRVDWVADAAGHKTTLTYDEVTGRTIAQTDALGHTTRTGYDIKGQVIHVWGDATYPVSYEYDVYGRKVKMFTYRTSGVDWNSESWPSNAGAGDTTTWIYDPESGLLTEKHDNEEKGPVYTYTLDGKLLTRKWARTDSSGNDLVTTYSYDSQTGELTGVDYSDSTPDVSFSYDRMGRQQEITDAAGVRTFAYNADFSLASEAVTGIYDKVLSRSYDSVPGVKGRYAGISVGAGYSVSYGYDEKGRMNQVSWNVGGTNGVGGVPGATNYTYVPGSDLLAGMSTVRTDGAYTPVTATYTYENKRDVKTQVLNKAGARTISQYDYRYNSVGNRTSVVNSGEAFGSQHPASSPENREGFNLYGYNSRSEVTESKRYSGTDVDNPVDVVKPEYRSYAYDPIGNRTNSTEGCDAAENGKTSSYDTNGLNQYTGATTGTSSSCSASAGATSGLADGSTTFTYDADGNMTSISDATGYTIYSFDCENRLVDVTIQTQSSLVRKVTFAYDFMGRRISKSVSSWNNNAWSPTSSRTFTWDGWLMTDETVTTGSAQPETTSYVWGLDLSQSMQGAGGVGGLLSMTSECGNSFNCYLYDANGNVTQLINFNTCNVASQYEYNISGNILYYNGYSAENNPFKFSSKYFDFEIYMYYYGYRYLSTNLGRFTNRDIIYERGGINLYSAALNNSNKYLDYKGLRPFTANEKKQLFSFFRLSLNINDVDVQIAFFDFDPGHSLTVKDIRLPKEYFFNNNDNCELRLYRPFYFSGVAHELFHIWQRQHGKHVSIPAAILKGMETFSDYDPYDYPTFIYDPDKLLTYFLKANVEQQAQIVEDMAYSWRQSTTPSRIYRKGKFDHKFIKVLKYIRSLILLNNEPP